MTKTMKFFALFLTFALLTASAATYTVTIFQASEFGGKELKPGEYKLVVESDKAVIQKGKEKIEQSVKIENSDSKFAATSVRYSDQNGKMKVQEIRLGGTTTKLVCN